MSSETAEGSEDRFVLTAIEPAWVEQQYRVTPDSIEPITEPTTGEPIDEMFQESTYTLDNGTELSSWSEVNHFSELLSGTEEQVNQFLQAVGEEPIVEEAE